MIKISTARKMWRVKTRPDFSPRLWTLAEHIFQIAYVLPSSDTVKNVSNSNNNMFGSLIYTALLYQCATVWRNECDKLLCLLVFFSFASVYSIHKPT